jgi:hypothetical protein
VGTAGWLDQSKFKVKTKKGEEVEEEGEKRTK